MSPEAIGFIMLRIAQAIVIAYSMVVLWVYGRKVMPDFFEAVAAVYAIQAVLVVGVFFSIDADFDPSFTNWTWAIYEFTLPILMTKVIMSRAHPRRHNISSFYL